MLTSSWSTDKTKVVEFGYMILHDGSPIAEFCTPIFVVAGPDGDQSAVIYTTETDHAKSRRESFVGTPVSG